VEESGLRVQPTKERGRDFLETGIRTSSHLCPLGAVVQQKFLFLLSAEKRKSYQIVTPWSVQLIFGVYGLRRISGALDMGGYGDFILLLFGLMYARKTLSHQTAPQPTKLLPSPRWSV
jgi:hypothetical protein